MGTLTDKMTATTTPFPLEWDALVLARRITTHTDTHLGIFVEAEGVPQMLHCLL